MSLAGNRLLKLRRIWEDDQQAQNQQDNQNQQNQQGNNQQGQVSEQQKQEFNKFINKIRGAANYDASVKAINDIVSDPKNKAILALGFGGDLGKKVLNYEENYIPVKNLHPTQNEIDFGNSMKYNINPVKIDNLKGLVKGGNVKVVSPIITYNGKYIIDGHHRWSQAYCANSKSAIAAFNITGQIQDPVEILKICQATIASNLGKVPSSTANPDMNIYKLSDDQMRDYILNGYSEGDAEYNFTGITDEAVAAFIEVSPRLANKDVSNQVSEARVTDKDSVVNYLINNCNQLKSGSGIAPGSPSRAIMPQTGDDKQFMTDINKSVTMLSKAAGANESLAHRLLRVYGRAMR